MLSKVERSAHWSRLVAEHEASGEMISSWCRNRNIAVGTFDYWKRRLKASPSTALAPVCPEWLSVTMATPVQPASLSSSLSLRVGKVFVDVPSGFNSALLGDILTLLESRC